MPTTIENLKQLSKEDVAKVSKKLAVQITTKILVGVVVTVSVALISAKILEGLADEVTTEDTEPTI